MTVNASTYDAPMVNVAASDSGANRYLIMPVRKTAGRKTASVVTVPARMAPDTSRVPSRAASIGDLPIR